MPSSHRVRIGPEARDDIRDLLQYTLQTWGRAHRDQYQSLVRRALEDLATYPAIGEERLDLGQPYRRLIVEQHVIYYRVESNIVRVIRVLHVRRDAPRELAE
ncbi:MAG: type II toxin-antitoxin system RelE/ParE family toxin [Thermomicrobiales bacterium]